MGSSASKPAVGSDPHVWKGSAAPSVSSDVIESLQSSNETDTSRRQTQELHIQARVAEELRRLHAKEAEALKAAQDKLSELLPGKQGEAGQGRSAVAKEIDALRARLEERKQVHALPESVETARGNVVRCLRENDRRPLDCWQEVEKFKEEVRRLEKGWVEKVVS